MINIYYLVKKNNSSFVSLTLFNIELHNFNLILSAGVIKSIDCLSISVLNMTLNYLMEMP